MKVVQLFLPGTFEDAYLYNEKLFILTEERTLRMYNFEHLLDALVQQDTDLSPVIAMAFGNNNWNQERIVRDFLKNSEIQTILKRGFDVFPQPYLTVNEQDAKQAMQVEFDVQIPDTTLLDMQAYHHRLYIGASAGLYHIAWDYHTFKDTLYKRLDARCLHITTGFGSVIASCGKDGLFAASDEFGWTQKGNTPFPEMNQQDSSKSLRTAWVDYDLINYSSYDNPTFLGNDVEWVPTNTGQRQDERIVTHIGKVSFPMGKYFERICDAYRNPSVHGDGRNHTYSPLGEQEQVARTMEKETLYDVHPSSIQYSYNTNRRFFVHTYDGHFHAFDISYNTYQDKQPKMCSTEGCTEVFTGGGSRILSAHTLAKKGLAIETDEKILYFDDAIGDWTLLEDREAMAIRTFPRSARYQNIVAITQEEGVLLVSILDDNCLSGKDS
jgi:hypothetical protein